MTTLTLAATGLDSVVLSDVAVVRTIEVATGEVRAVAEDAPDADGEIDTSQLHKGGTVTIGLRLTSGEPFVTQLRRIKAFTNGRLRPTLTVDYGDGAPLLATLSRGTVTTTTGRPTHQDAVVQFAIPSGILESAELHEEAIVPGAGTADGLEFTTTLEFGPTIEFPLVDPPGTAEVVNAGDRDAYPVIRAFGPFGVEGDAGDETTIGNETTGLSLVFAGMAIAAGDYLEIDFRAKTILVNGDSAQSRYGYLVFPDSRWWTLQPGTNEVSFGPDTFTGNANAILYYRSAYS